MTFKLSYIIILACRLRKGLNLIAYINPEVKMTTREKLLIIKNLTVGLALYFFFIGGSYFFAWETITKKLSLKRPLMLISGLFCFLLKFVLNTDMFSIFSEPFPKRFLVVSLVPWDNRPCNSKRVPIRIKHSGDYLDW